MGAGSVSRLHEMPQLCRKLARIGFEVRGATRQVPVSIRPPSPSEQQGTGRFLEMAKFHSRRAVRE